MAAGIDFGTSNCSVGIWKDGQASLLPLDGTSARMPSVLFLAAEATRAPVSDRDLARRVQIAKQQQTLERPKRRSALEEAERALRQTRRRIRESEQAPAASRANRGGHDANAESEADALERQHTALQRELETREATRDLRKRQVEAMSRSDSELRTEQRGILRREAFSRDLAAAAERGLRERLSRTSGTHVGSDAVQRYLAGDPGTFVVSPKSFLGSDVPQRELTTFTDVVTRMFMYMRAVAQARFPAVGLVVVGRPVHFRGTKGVDGDRQAEHVLRTAANNAGFPDVEFLAEPVAAALGYERSLENDKTVLVLDVGGGTTDCTMIRIGPSYRDQTDRESSVLGTDGMRIGGRDLDYQLAYREVGPLLGLGTKLRDGLPFPLTYIEDALTSHIPRRNAFHSPRGAARLRLVASRSCSPQCMRRLERLQRERLGDYVILEAERAKIELSTSDTTLVRLDRVEAGWSTAIDVVSYAELAADIHRSFLAMIDNVVHEAGVYPDEVYLTGGMAQSPVLRALLQEHLGEIRLVDGDYFGSVVAGLTTWAGRAI